MSASPPSRSCSAIVTKVLAAPDSNQTLPLMIWPNQSRRAWSRALRSNDVASSTSRRALSTRPSSYAVSAAATRRAPFRRGSAVKAAARSRAAPATVTAPRAAAPRACCSSAEAMLSSGSVAAMARCQS